MPLDGATSFKLREETWPPFSWFPWFTANPWALLPVFLVDRAHHHRARLAALARLEPPPALDDAARPSVHRPAPGDPLPDRRPRLAGVRGHLRGVGAGGRPQGVSAGQLAALPLLLFPPAIFLAALVLELSPLPHRFAWGLVSVLAGAGGLYSLAIAMTGTANNLNLSYYVLLGILCLLAAPRAFSAGRMGWSRNSMPRYA